MSSCLELFLKYGGMSFWTEFIDQFYERVTECPELRSFFIGKDQRRIKDMQLSLLEMALTGERFPPDVIREVHRGMDISTEHFAKFMHLYQKVLADMDMEPEDVTFLTELMFGYKDLVVVPSDPR